MLKGYPAVKSHEETDDVLQSALIRLNRALEEVRPTTVADYIGLSALQIRRELLDLARHYARRPWHIDMGHDAQNSSSTSPPAADPPDQTAGPATLAQWTDFHRLVEKLPHEERQVFDSHFYGGLSIAETAVQLDMAERTVKRRWQSARLSLHKALHGGDASGASL
jgi:RNA polymerase sigma-70 factor (ECF subfamily)